MSSRLNIFSIFLFLIACHQAAQGLDILSRVRRYAPPRLIMSLPDRFYKDGFVSVHNLLRKGVKPQPANMKMLAWDEKLASLAQEHAKKCVFDHSTTEFRKTKRFPEVGEDIAKNDFSPAIVGQTATLQWYREALSYNYTTNTCLPNKVCGHYTQVVWANTERVGCGVAYCSNLLGDEMSGFLIACEYGPIGNVKEVTKEGVKAEKPYKEGKPCSKCEQGYETCQNGLCVKVSNVEDDELSENMENVSLDEEQEDEIHEEYDFRGNVAAMDWHL